MRFSRARYVTLCQQSLVTAAVLAVGLSAAGVKTLDIGPQPGTAADAQVLHRMARNGIEQIAGFLNAPERPPAAAPEPNLVTLVSRRDDSPEAAGIFRVSGAQDSTPDGQPEASTTAGAVEAPPPPRARAARTRSASVAPATDGRAPYP